MNASKSKLLHLCAKALNKSYPQLKKHYKSLPSTKRGAFITYLNYLIFKRKEADDRKPETAVGGAGTDGKRLGKK